MSLRSIVMCLSMMLLAVHAARIPAFALADMEDQEESNELQPNGPPAVLSSSWVQIDQAPTPLARRAPGETLELNCDAMGSPPPVITWLRDGVPITEGEEYSSNMVGDSSGRGMAKVRATLLVNNILPAERSVYTCLAQAADKSAQATSTVYTQGAVHPTNLTSYVLLNQEALSAPSRPRILLHYVNMLEETGSALLLPCKAWGHPRPHVTWYDSSDRPILPNNHRFKVMQSGELLVAGLRWSDMGSYTCVVKNQLGKESMSTFVYPLKENDN